MEGVRTYAPVANRPTLDWTPERLERAPEADLRDTLELDVLGGVNKLLELGLFLKDPDGHLVAQDPVEALRMLDEHWGRHFYPDEAATPHV